MRTLLIEDQEIEIGGQEWSDNVLSGDPFEGDYFEGSTLEDKIVKARNTKKTCHSCYSLLQPGTFTRSIVCSEVGKIMKMRFCEDCCNDLGYGEVLFEGNKYYDIDSEEFEEACIEIKPNVWQEPKPLWEVREEIRVANVEYLEKKLGRRYFEAPQEIIYKTLKEREEV